MQYVMIKTHITYLNDGKDRYVSYTATFNCGDEICSRESVSGATSIASAVFKGLRHAELGQIEVHLNHDGKIAICKTEVDGFDHARAERVAEYLMANLR